MVIAIGLIAISFSIKWHDVDSHLKLYLMHTHKKKPYLEVSKALNRLTSLCKEAISFINSMWKLYAMSRRSSRS